MYEFLEGQVSGRSAARLVLAVNGVGYDLAVPLLASFPEGRAKVWTHLVVREDSQQLFGFPDPATRDLFRLLLTVAGVGPRVALGVVSGLPRDELVEAIRGGDVARLTSIKGVGAKTAQQIVLDLQKKVAVLALPADRAAAAAPAGVEQERQRRVEDAVAALVSIGYGEKDARKQVEKAAAKLRAGGLEDLVRASLQA